MPRELIDRLRAFRRDHFPRFEEHYRRLAADGQRPTVLFIGCSDSRLVPHLLMDSKPGEVFMVRNVGNIVPPYEDAHGYHGTSAAIEFAVLVLGVREIVVCGHADCGAIRALYQAPPAEARHMTKWLELAREATLPEDGSAATLRRVEQRSIVLQLEHLLSFPMVKSRVERGELFLHGWYYDIGHGKVQVLDVASGEFVPIEAG
jgi:carbonic anhydrase